MSPPGPIADVGAEPTYDGQVTQFVAGEALGSRYFDRERRVIFVNGMGNSGANHRDSALALSVLQMCRVVGVYNLTGGFITDLVQCVTDKLQFDGLLADSADTSISQAESASGAGDRARAAMTVLRARNTAAAAMFDLLRNGDYRDADIFAHSQGNLITSNALSALEIVDGAAEVSRHLVHTFGSPAMNWPRSARLEQCGFTFDPVTWLAGMDMSFSISKVGMPADSIVPITHAFTEYMRNDAAFVVNRFRWGGLGMTFSLDEEGLARGLVQMGHNLPRVLGVFRRLADAHNSDVDDVALLYVEMLQRLPQGPGILQEIRSEPQLLRLLVEAMEGGWTSSRERNAIDFLRRP